MTSTDFHLSYYRAETSQPNESFPFFMGLLACSKRTTVPSSVDIYKFVFTITFSKSDYTESQHAF